MARERYAAAFTAIFENLVPLDFFPMIDRQYALATNIRYLHSLAMSSPPDGPFVSQSPVLSEYYIRILTSQLRVALPRGWRFTDGRFALAHGKRPPKHTRRRSTMEEVFESRTGFAKTIVKVVFSRRHRI